MKNSPTLKEFTDQIASKEPVPGGGSVSAHAGAQAASLLAMYCQLSLGKAELAEVRPLMETTLKQAQDLIPILLTDVERDSDSFSDVVRAFKLPKANDDEKKIRAFAIQGAFTGAARVPLEVAQRCLRLLELIEGVVGKGNNSAITDVGVANLLAWAGLQGAVYNVKINLGSIKDGDLVSKLGTEAGRILTHGEALHEQNAVAVNALIVKG
jgi:formiminotetrahydrofolate cyclodeaminase